MVHPPIPQRVTDASDDQSADWKATRRTAIASPDGNTAYFAPKNDWDIGGGIVDIQISKSFVKDPQRALSVIGISVLGGLSYAFINAKVEPAWLSAVVVGTAMLTIAGICVAHLLVGGRNN